MRAFNVGVVFSLAVSVIETLSCRRPRRYPSVAWINPNACQEPERTFQHSAPETSWEREEITFRSGKRD